MKVFIFGSNGMLGNYMRSYLSKSYQVTGLTRKDYDLQNISIDSLRKFLNEKGIVSGDTVINCAGVIPQASEQRSLNTSIYFRINSIFPIILSMICEQNNVRMIHITTDCIYSGTDGNYSETSIPDGTTDYAISKSLGELCNATIIRTSIVGEEIYNKRSLLEWVRSNEGKEINGFTNHLWNGVTCLQLSKIIHNMIHNDIYWNGIKHIFSPQSVNKYELVSIINNVYNLNIKITKYEHNDKSDKTITTIHEQIFMIPSIQKQIEEMKSYII